MVHTVMHRRLLFAAVHSLNDVSKQTVAVIGLGSVGSAMIHWLSNNHNCIGYDTHGKYDWDLVLKTKFAFVCVPTPSKERRLDCSIVDSVLKKLNDDCYKGIIIIKSTLSIGTMEMFCERYPALKMVYMPEFLRELNSYSWCEKPDRIVISGKEEDCNTVLSLFDLSPDVPILRMSHAEAELGKLAHNAYIATKVSFTNTVEMIAEHCGADPNKVMSVIWTDRRVKNRAHLMPGVGGYSGKCIPKDTSELLEFSITKQLNCSLLNGVEDVNNSVVPSTMNIPVDVYVIITTAQQDGLIERAMASVCEQTVRPKGLVIVYDEPLGNTLHSIVEKFREYIAIDLIPNVGKRNLSGAVNTGLSHLRDKCSDLDFVALLDDDDYWECRYLQNCLGFAHDMGCDWVISGIIRHDVSNPNGIRQPIPKKITISDFLTGNPNVQGSNLFIKFKKLDAVGGFSEELNSTTDRDVCIKLLGIPGIKVETLRNHLVHHDCISRHNRLSSVGSDIKKDGLMSFYKKYRKVMTSIEDAKFRERCETFFGVPKECFDHEADTFCPELWNSVSIDHRGNVFSCCLNKPAKLGNIYKNRLSDMINCDDLIKHRDASLSGCLDCYSGCTWVKKGAKEAHPNSSVIEYNNLKTITIAFGESCNISCIMCRQRKRSAEVKERLDPEALIKNVSIDPFSTIFLTGGEPLLMEESLAYMSHLSKIGKRFGLSTNGMLLNESVSRFLAPNINFITISLNAATKEMHEMVNRGSSFDTVLNNIRYLRGLRESMSLRFDIIGRMTITVESLKEIPAFIQNYQKLGFDKINFGFDKETVPKYIDNDPVFKNTLRNEIISELRVSDCKNVDTHRLSVLGLTE